MMPMTSAVAAVSPAAAAATMPPAAAASAMAPAAAHARAKRADRIHHVPERSFIACSVPVMLMTEVVASVAPAATSVTCPNDLMALVRDQSARFEKQKDRSDADACPHRTELRGVFERALLATLAVEAGSERPSPEAIEGILLVIGPVLKVPVEERELVKVFVGDRHVFFFLFL